ncbi:MAG: Asp-tRNA(Asn)/Glu-tRNA(Gln) amidotransferase subunit GatB [Verrucomicrobia bacterium]|nr:Asp-tRNA(Asn)/Glu-tRNA(Gln) amidotransferase subunit GatB [Verrucomicrobiota bacterium]
MEYVATIGLETHVQLKTASKIWCGCANVYGSRPNTDVCPVCLGYPGSLPVLNREAVKLTVMTGLMLGCEISRYSKWDRKSYFYPDMPKNYQISQYDMPLCLGGQVEIDVDGAKRAVRLTRIHLEEDVGKSTHFERSSGVDFNRAGTPLMEIVTEPDMSSAEEAFAYLQALKRILLYGGVSDCNLEQGNMRCDINVSVRPADTDKLGTKAEIKNMNTFKGVFRALKYEIERQKKVLSEGGEIRQETRRWDDDAGVTSAMRSKEYAHDYRYFPDPDLMPVVLTEEQIHSWEESLPELPAARRARILSEYGIPEYDAGVIVADKAVADYYETVARLSGNAKAASNWIMTEMMRALSEAGIEITSTKISPDALADLIKLIDGNAINMTGAKEVFNVLFSEGGDPKKIVEERGLAQVSDSSELESVVRRVIDENPKSVEDYKAGKKVALQFMMGQVMRITKGKANPQVVVPLLKQILDA